MHFYDAIKQFQENTQLVDPHTDPIMWNLNAGLANIADGLRALEAPIDNLEATMRVLAQSVHTAR